MPLETSEGVNYSRNSWLIYVNLDSMCDFVSFHNAGKLLKFEFWKTYKKSYFNFWLAVSLLPKTSLSTSHN